jgi:hypothetical protein
MIKIVFAVFIYFIPCVLFAQVSFKNITLKEALKEASQTGKLIFLQFESSECLHCNEVANKAFSSNELALKIKEACIPIKISNTHIDREKVETLCNVKGGYGSFFIDNNSNLVHSFKQTNSRSSAYIDQINLAYTKASESLRVIDLEKEYKNGNRDISFIRLLLEKKKSVGLSTDILLEEYVNLLAADSLKSVHTIAYLAQYSPIINSKVDKIIREDNNLFSKAWYSISLHKRISINNIIIYKSLKKAIELNDEQFAIRVAHFAKNTHDGNAKSGEKAYNENLLKFYSETKNNNKYIDLATKFYDEYYMTISVDSIKTIDSLDRFKNLPKQNIPLDTTSNKTFVRKDVKQIIRRSFSPSSQKYTSELSFAALQIYNICNTTTCLTKALEWAKRANEFYENPSAMDIYAKLLFKTGSKQEAIKFEKMAIELQKKRGYPTTLYEAELARMNQ